MTRLNVGQLIDVLSGFPPDLPVVVDGYEGGLTEHLHVERTTAEPGYYGTDAGTIFGEHGDHPILPCHTIEVVAIHRWQT